MGAHGIGRLAAATGLTVQLVLLASCASPAGSTADGTPRSTTSASAEVPYAPAATVAACEAEAQVLQLAEQAFSTLNGAYATLDQLLHEQLLRRPPGYYTAVRVGVPSGGYTLVGGPKCGNLPVAG